MTAARVFYAATSTLAFVLALGSTVRAQTYDTQLLLTQLATPTGIALDAQGRLLFTEVPQPGVMGGSNAISRREMNGAISVLATGMPEPLNIATFGSDVYWTCRTAGVVYGTTPGFSGMIAQGLNQPIGIAADGAGNLFITQVPTPGVNGNNGGTNTVDALTAGVASTLVTGNPEPYDVVSDAQGNLYWTCRTAGVILRRSVGGMVTPVLRGLQRPSGIAMDAVGNLYFTEVPTPGVFGTMGGRNRVWKFDISTRNLTLINFGDPEPTDIAVSPSGDTVYWTCTSAGVIIRATRTGSAPEVLSLTDAAPGSAAVFLLNAPDQPGSAYFAASSYGLGTITLGTRRVALEEDFLFQATLLDAMAPYVEGYVGTLDPNGQGLARLTVPENPGLSGLAIYTAFITVDASGLQVTAVSATNRTVIP